MSGLDWQGEVILRRIERACREAIDEVTGAASAVAKQLVHRDTGALQKSIGRVKAEVQGDQIVGAFGSLDDPGYAIWQEYLPEPHGKAYLRPAADQEFPKLGARIARRLGQ
jgi:hypothetical protein